MSLLTFPVKFKLISLFLPLFAAVSNGKAQCMSFNDSIFTISGIGNPDQAIREINLSAARFTKPLNSRINFGVAGNEYKYILLKLNAPCTWEGHFLSIDNTSLDTISIYKIVDNDSSRLLYQGGNLVPFKKQRSYVWHTLPVEISINLSFYLIALKAQNKNINVRYEILGKNDLQKKYQSYDRFVFFYIGIVCLIISIMVLAICLFREKVFVAYLGYIICLSIWILSHYGYLFPFLYPHSPVINEIIKPLSSLGASFFLLLVLNIAFSKNIQSWLQKLIKGVVYILPLLAGLMLVLVIPGFLGMMKGILITAWHIALAFSICIILITPLFVIKSGPTAKIFVSAMLVTGIMSIVQLFANSGYINDFFINEHGMTMASLLEVSIMAFGLFYSLLEDKKHREMHMLVLEQEKTETLKKLITVQDNERKRIAGDLHDNIGPLLAALKINFRRLIHVKHGDSQDGLITKTESIIDDSITEIRNVAHNLMPKGLSSKGLITTLTEYFGDIQQLYNVTIEFRHQIESIFQPDLQINVYRIVCELVLNAARHSNSRQVTVGIQGDDKRVCISIIDEGQGFQQKAGDSKKSLGLQSAESRVSYLKGKFSLITKPGKGTTIDIEIPLQFNKSHVNGL